MAEIRDFQVPSGRFHQRGGVRATLFLVILAVMILLTKGCLSTEAIKHARDNRAASQGDANDESLSEGERHIGLVNYDQWCVQCNLLGDDPLPEDVQARFDAHAATVGSSQQ